MVTVKKKKGKLSPHWRSRFWNGEVQWAGRQVCVQQGVPGVQEDRRRGGKSVNTVKREHKTSKAEEGDSACLIACGDQTLGAKREPSGGRNGTDGADVLRGANGVNFPTKGEGYAFATSQRSNKTLPQTVSVADSKRIGQRVPAKRSQT